MKKILVILALAFLLIATGKATASDISSAVYYGKIRATNNSTAAQNVTTVASMNTTALISAGLVNSSATNIAILNSTGSDTPFMPGLGDNVWAVWFSSVPNGNIDATLYTDASGGKIRYAPGPNGMAVTDNTSLWPAANFTVEQSGWIDTDNGSDKNLFIQPGAIKSYVSDSAAGNITSTIAVATLDFTRANSDWVSIPDHADFSFTAGGGNDNPYSIVGWINLDDATSSTIIAKYTAAGNNVEWQFATSATDALFIYNLNPNASILQGRRTDAAKMTGYEGEWVHVAATYDGNNLVGGYNIYINGVDSDTTNVEVGVYPGMTAGNAVVELGSINAGTGTFLDGILGSNLKIYDVELTPTEVVTDFGGGHKEANLVAWYQLDEGTGNPQDSSGNAHHATANLADWTSSLVPNTNSVTATGVTSAEHTVITTLDRSSDDSTLGTTASAQKAFYPAADAIDDDNNSMWHSNDITTAWFRIDLGTGNITAINRYTIRSHIYGNDNNPSDWTFEGSNDAVNWTVLDTQTGINPVVNDYDIYDISNTTNYRYYQLNITAVDVGAHIRIAEFELFGLALTIDIDGTPTTTARRIIGVPNSSANWTFMQNNVMPYMEYAEITVGGTQVGYWDWEYNTYFYDSSGYGNTATPTFRTSSSDADVSTALISFTPVSLAEVDEDTSNVWGTMVDDAPDEPATAYTEDTRPGLFFEPLVHSLWALTDLPDSVFWYNFAFFFILAGGMASFYVLAKNNKQALLLKCIVMTAIMIFFALPGPNIYGLYVVIYFIFWQFGVLVLSKSYGW